MPVRVRGMGSFRRSQSREKPTPALHYSVVRRDLAYSLTRWLPDRSCRARVGEFNGGVLTLQRVDLCDGNVGCETRMW